MILYVFEEPTGGEMYASFNPLLASAAARSAEKRHHLTQGTILVRELELSEREAEAVKKAIEGRANDYRVDVYSRGKCYQTEFTEHWQAAAYIDGLSKERDVETVHMLERLGGGEFKLSGTMINVKQGGENGGI